MLDILEGICSGSGTMEDIDLLLELAQSIKEGSLCGLGQSAPNPVLTTLRYFREEYEEHIKHHHCRAAVCKGLVEAPCSHICPAAIDVPRYVRFIERNKPAEALAVIREKIPFPAVCGLVCFHPCEAKCRRGQLDEAIAIRQLKRYAIEHGGDLWKKNLKISPPTGKRVAVVGSGPAGLSAAYYLAKQGHSVTVFEALPEAGGMMRVAIPDYRLPKDILAKDIREIENLGVEIKTEHKIDSVDKLFDDGYNAVFLAVGAHQGIKMGFEGEDSPHVIDCVEFLRDVSLGKKIDTGDRVAVIGGGNVAMDGARTALRLGAKDVVVIYRRTRAEMPADAEEIEATLAEGVQFKYLLAPSRIISCNGNPELETIEMELGEIDSSGRRRPQPIEGSQSATSFNTVIAAIGQRPVVPQNFNIDTGRGNVIRVDPDTLATAREGVFAGGDAVTGPASIIEAIAHGRRAAVSIDIYLGGNGDIDEKLAPPEAEVAPLEEAEEKWRPQTPVLPVKKRLCGFEQVELGYDKDMAVEEAGRCLRCDLEEDE
jgi:NADH-quinone oxidoreductase subunit F